MIGRRPEPVPGVEPGRWRVVRARGLPESERAWWYVDRENCHGSMSFPTWREAQDYADRMARTREVVLPRVLHSGDWVPNMPTLKIGWERHPAGTTFWVEDGAWNVITVRPNELHPLANALHALAEQEGAV